MLQIQQALLLNVACITKSVNFITKHNDYFKKQ